MLVTYKHVVFVLHRLTCNTIPNIGGMTRFILALYVKTNSPFGLIVQFWVILKGLGDYLLKTK